MTAPPATGLRAIDPGPFRLRHEATPVPAGAGLDAVVLDRRIRPFRRGGAPLAARVARGLRGGFQWDREDSNSKEWYPQGVDGRGHLLLVSWYSKADGAARLSVVDLDAGRYGHVALLGKGGAPVKTHAGGLAWREDVLYVADTTRGLRLFDLRCFAGATLPQAGTYRPAEKGLRFSYTSVDEAGGSLLVGEYTDQVPGARLVRWPFAPGGLLAQEPASDAWASAHANLQGALVMERPRADGRQQREDARGLAHRVAVRRARRAPALGDRRRGPRRRGRRGRLGHRAPGPAVPARPPAHRVPRVAVIRGRGRRPGSDRCRAGRAP